MDGRDGVRMGVESKLGCTGAAQVQSTCDESSKQSDCDAMDGQRERDGRDGMDGMVSQVEAAEWLVLCLCGCVCELGRG